MTDQNQAPERIWTCAHVGEYGRYYPEAVEAEGEYGGIAVEFIRKDLHDAAIKRQAGAAKTLRNATLSEVQYLKDMDRSEYNAAKSLDSEREANARLTAEVEALAKQRDELVAELREAEDRANKFATKEMHTEKRALKAEAERDQALASVGAILDEIRQEPIGAMISVERIRRHFNPDATAALNEMLADAWEEGWEACVRDNHIDTLTPNPYRQPSRSSDAGKSEDRG